jgi:hypothetical protein
MRRIFFVFLAIAAAARADTVEERRSGIGGDSQVEIGRVELWGEMLRGTFEPDDRLPLRRPRSTGGYGQAAVYLIEDKLQLVGRYETFTPNTTLSTGRTRTSVFGVNYYFKQHDLKLHVDYLHGTVGDLRGEQNKVIARLQTVF